MQAPEDRLPMQSRPRRSTEPARVTFSMKQAARELVAVEQADAAVDKQPHIEGRGCRGATGMSGGQPAARREGAGKAAAQAGARRG